MDPVINVYHYVVGTEQPAFKSIERTLGNLQDLVGGYIEVVHLREGLQLVCNEEGLIRHLPVGFLVASAGGIIPIHGNFFICRQFGSNFASVRGGDYERIINEVFPRRSKA